MATFETAGFFLGNAITGNETVPLDTNATQGQQPQQAASRTVDNALAYAYLTSSTSKTMVAGTRYITGPYPMGPGSGGTVGVLNVTVPRTVNGVAVLVGGTGGTDKWIAELHDSAGNLLATSSLSGVTAGTANQWMQLPFTAAYSAPPGNYYLVIQSNGTTATLATFNAPTSPMVTGSAAGTFGTGAAITPPTTYTQALGPVALFY